MGRPVEDLSGQRFGRLVVEGPHERRWRCRCDCGAERVVHACNLRIGNIRSCGCIRAGSREDLTGQRFGRLVVEELVQGQRWRCRCDCGGERVVVTSNLRIGNIRSCGCLRRERKADLTGQRNSDRLLDLAAIGPVLPRPSWISTVE